MSGLEKGFTVFVSGLITIAVLNVAFSKPNTAAVLGAAGNATSQSLLAAQGQG